VKPKLTHTLTFATYSQLLCNTIIALLEWLKLTNRQAFISLGLERCVMDSLWFLWHCSAF